MDTSKSQLNSSEPITDRGSVQLPVLDEYIQSATIGLTVRVWNLPFQAITVDHSPTPVFIGSGHMNTAANTREFLARYASVDLSNLRDTVEALRKTPLGEWLTVTHKMLIDPEGCAIFVSKRARAPRPTQLPPPTEVPIPTITPDHWYYRRHYTPGNYTAPTQYSESSHEIEAEQDIQSLIHYMSTYDALARNPSGRHLFAVTHGAE